MAVHILARQAAADYDALRAYTVGHKKHGTLLLSISLPIIDLFSKFFH